MGFGDSMQVGTVVRYRKKYPDGMEIDWIGLVVDNTRVGVANSLVQWSNGMRHWIHESDLEVLCK